MKTVNKQEKREIAVQILNTFSAEVLENGNTEIKSWRELNKAEIKILSDAADGIDNWTILNSIGGSCGKSYSYECELPSGNYDFIDVVTSRGNFTKGFTAYFMK